jgi:hypothetical protein
VLNLENVLNSEKMTSIWNLLSIIIKLATKAAMDIENWHHRVQNPAFPQATS